MSNSQFMSISRPQVLNKQCPFFEDTEMPSATSATLLLRSTDSITMSSRPMEGALNIGTCTATVTLTNLQVRAI